MVTALIELRAVAEETRLRAFYLLSHGELTVADLVEILHQSQPRVSRHLKILAEAGIITRSSEGAQVFCRLNYSGQHRKLISAILDRIEPTLAPYSTDKEALYKLRQKRTKKAAAYFQSVASNWDYQRSLLVPEKDIEKTILKRTAEHRFKRHLDLGTGTGRMLALLSHIVEEGLGLDHSKDMLAVARARLAALPTDRFSVRQSDLNDLDDTQYSANLITLHMVLHYLENPRAIFRAASRLLAPDGVLMLIDLLPHNLETLRQEKAHRRLGFSREELTDWAKTSSLKIKSFDILKGSGLDVFVALYHPLEGSSE